MPALQKGAIKVLTGSQQNTVINVLYYPSEYSIDSGNQFASTTINGLSEPLVQFISGNSQTLNMELFFDTYESRSDVRTYTDKVANLVNVDSELHAPPVCAFIWGQRSSGKAVFKGVLEKVSQKFTMFLNDGIPVRAKLTATFRSCRTIEEQFRDIPRHSSDRTKQKMLNEGDQLWMLADLEYQDPGKWREIAEANNIDNPRLLEHGKTLVIPRLE